MDSNHSEQISFMSRRIEDAPQNVLTKTVFELKKICYYSLHIFYGTAAFVVQWLPKNVVSCITMIYFTFFFLLTPSV